jgi:LysM repeat protein
VASRPARSDTGPPPTLAAPTATPNPTATAVPPSQTVAEATAAAAAARSYTVQRGDELKHIAAQYGVSIWKIIDANEIPDPDSLKVGQVLSIPHD